MNPVIATMLLSGIIFFGGFKMKQKKIKVLMVEPGKNPIEIELSNDLDSLQKAVSRGTDYRGLIELIYVEPGVLILANEEGKLNGMEGNRKFGYDILCGVFYVCSEDDEGNLASLSEENMAKYKSRFWHPEFYTDDDVQRAIYYDVKEWE